MPVIESTQHKLDRVRPPRVQITYDVETGGAIEKLELPFVFGIMADLGRNPDEPLPLLKDRKFVEIDRDNFNAILKSIRPTLGNVKAPLPTAEDPDAHLTVGALQFTNIDDFSPINVLSQVPELSDLFEQRQLLSELQSRLDGNDALTASLGQPEATQRWIATRVTLRSCASANSASANRWAS